MAEGDAIVVLDLPPPDPHDREDPSFSVALRLGERAVPVYLRGELDYFTVNDLRVTLTQLRSDDHRHVVLDLSELTFLSTAGIGAFAEATAECAAIGGTLFLVHPSTQSRRALALTDADHMIVDAH